MELIIVFVVIVFLIGTVSLAVPSKSSRNIANLRMEASRLGFKVSSSRYGNLSFKNKDFSLMSYQLKNTTNLKDAHFIRDKDDLILYSPLKLKYSDEYEGVNDRLQKISFCIHEIIFSNTSIAFLWNEKEGLEELKKILDAIEDF
jgi:hypothetical protein